MLEPSDRITTQTARSRIGGRWALSRQTFAITGVLGVFALVSAEAQSGSASFPLGAWTLVAVVGMAATGLLLLALNATIFRNRRVAPLPLWVVVLADGLCGAVFAVFVEVMADLLGLTPATSLLERVVFDALFAMWWGPTLSYFMALREEWAKEREGLIAAAVQVELTAISQAELLDRMQQEIDTEVSTQLQPARERITAMRATSALPSHPPVDESDWIAAAELLRGTADESVRPLSKKLWASATSRYPSMPWWSLVGNIFKYQPFRPLAFAFIDIAGTFAAQLRLYGFPRMTILLFGGLALTIALMLMFNTAMRRIPRWHALLFVIGLIALQTTVLARGYLREQWLPGSATSSWIITQMVATVLVVIVTSGFGAWWDSRRSVRDTLREDIQQDRIAAIARSQQLASIARESAQALHGSVQTRLITCAMVIEQASASGDVTMLNAALDEAIDILDQSTPEGGATGSAAEKIARKVELWDELCDFSVTIDPALEILGPSTTTSLARIVEDGIANSIRHGKATHIDIDISMGSGRDVHVDIRDNGIGPQGGDPGLGTAYLRQVSDGRWSLTALTTGSELRATITAVPA